MMALAQSRTPGVLSKDAFKLQLQFWPKQALTAGDSSQYTVWDKTRHSTFNVVTQNRQHLAY
jgi:hypothetical protein